MRQYWEAPEFWPGRAFVCIGGGPSLTQSQVAACKDREWGGHKVRVIAINDAYKMAPWADVLYFCDDKWWQWRHKDLQHWPGLIVRLQGGAHDHIVNLGSIDASPRHGGGDHMAAQGLGLGIVESAAIGLADRGTGGGDDDSLTHGLFS